MKISIICFDLSNNCLGRAYLLGKVLSRRYEVDIHGFYFSQSGEKIWRPCDTREFEYKAVKGRNFPRFILSMGSMIKDISGDVIYVSKLRMPSYGVGLLMKFIYGKPLVIDIDDLENSWFYDVKGLKRWKTIFNPIDCFYTQWMEKLVHFADDVTTVSTQLQERYGRGIIVPHGKDTHFLDPERFDRVKLREDYNLQAYKIIMFLGTPRPHKGVEDILHAVNALKRKDIRVMIVGKGSDYEYEERLLDIGKGKVILVDQIPFNDVPKFLSMADLIVVPQQKSLQTLGQIPAKIFDAMAMAKPVIATNISDIPQILNGCGIIVEPADIEMLSDKIEWVFSHPVEAEEIGRRAREKCIKEYSWDVMEERLAGIFEKYRMKKGVVGRYDLSNMLECPVCENKIEAFLPFGVKPRPSAQCPECKALERHRFVWLYFRERTNIFSDKLKMLHVAPEPQFAKLFSRLPNVEYLSADLKIKYAMVKMDITNIQYPDNYFDVIYCSHVFEHIPDDIKAMSELYRVMKPNGWAILLVPIFEGSTIEDADIKTPEDREKVFGQHDHVRKYGSDGKYKERLESVGFKVKVDTCVKVFSSEKIKRYGLNEKEEIYYCVK